MSGRTVAIIQARMTSTRLPGKVLKPLAGAPVLNRVVERVRRIEGVEVVCVATPGGSAHDPIAELVGSLDGVALARGPEEDVLRRFVIAAELTGAGTVVRITGDCPLVDSRASAAVISAYRAGGVPYARTSFDSGYPLGFDTEVVTVEALRTADREAVDPYEREHVTPFIWRRPERFPAVHVDYRPSRRSWRLVVDTAEDYELASRIYDTLYAADPAFGLAELESLFAVQPELLKINAAVPDTPYIGVPGN